jgi:hypothetical protein
MIGLLIAVFTAFYPMWRQNEIKRLEVEHMNAIRNSLLELKSMIGGLGAGDSDSISINLGRNTIAFGPDSPRSVAISVSPALLKTVRFYPSDDAYVVEDLPQMRFGGETSLRVASMSGGNERSFLKFSLTSVPAGVIVLNADLWLYCDGYTSPMRDATDVRCYSVDNDDWSEDNLAWENQPSMVNALDSRYIDQEGWVSLTAKDFVTQEIDGDKVVGLGLKARLEDYDGVERYVSFSSEEAAGNKPYLEVTYALGPGSWVQTDWSGGEKPGPQVGTWGIEYDNYYTGENENSSQPGQITLENASSTAYKLSGFIESSVYDAENVADWRRVTWSASTPSTTDFSHTYVQSETVYEGGTISFDNAKADDGNYENTYENLGSPPLGSLLVYGVGATGSTLVYRIWDGSAWGAETTIATLAGRINWVVLKYAQMRNEAVLVTLDATGAIRFWVWNGSSWSSSTLLSSIGTTNDAYRGFDVEYETMNDRAVVVYNNNNGADPAYRIWDGTSLSSPSTINIPTSGVPFWIELAPNPLSTSNEIVLMTLDANVDVYGMRWDGSAWSNMGAPATWDTSAAIATRKCIDVAYEQQTGRAMFIWGASVNQRQRYRIWDGSNLTAATNLDIPAMTRVANWVRLVPDPTSNRLMYGVQDEGADLNTRLWSGSAWDGAAQHPEHDRDTEDTRDPNFDIVFERFPGHEGHAWLFWGDAARVSRKQWTGSWSTATATGDDTAQVQLSTHPASNIVFALVYEDTTSATDDLWEMRLTMGGGTWTSKFTIWGGPTLSNPVMEPLMIAHRRDRSYRENVQHNITGIPASSNYGLQIEYYTTGDSESVSIYVYNFFTSGWDNLGNVQGGSAVSPNLFTYNLTGTNYILGGEVRVRYAQPDNDKTRTSLMVDYCRVETQVIKSTGITVLTRTGETTNPDDGTWSAWQACTNGSYVPSPNNRYIQYRIELWTETDKLTPVFGQIAINYLKAGVRVSPYGEINLNARNDFYPDQTYVYEAGGMILIQDGVDILVSEPTMVTASDAGGGNLIRVDATFSVIENRETTTASTSTATIHATCESSRYVVAPVGTEPNRENVILTISSIYSNAWSGYLQGLCDDLNDKGYNASFDGLTLTIQGKNTGPGADIYYYEKLNEIEVTIS